MADAVVTQVAVETLTQPAPDLRVTQAVVELLSTSVAVISLGAVVTQVAIEVLTPSAVAAVPVPDVQGKKHADAIADIVAAGLAPGQVKKENSDKVPPGHVIRQDPDPGVVVPPGTPVDLVISGGAGGGVGPIGMLPGKVTAANALQVTATVPTMLTAALAGSTALTDAVLIPAPAAAQRIVVRRITVSTLAAGPFSVRFASGTMLMLGPVWLTSGPAGVTSGRLFGSGPIAVALPPGQGLTVTTSADAPQTIEADYDLEPDR